MSFNFLEEIRAVTTILAIIDKKKIKKQMKKV